MMFIALTLAGCGTGSLTSDTPARQEAARQQAYVPPKAAPAKQAVPVTTRKVALLLPLTGPQAETGQSLLKAAMLAVQELAPQTLTLSVHDTNEGVQNAFAAAQSNGAQLVIGPLFSRDVQEIAGMARTANIPVLALSNDTSLAGQGVYVMGFWPGAQISRIMLFAQRNNIRSLAVLQPDDAYGRAIANSVDETIQPPTHIVKYARYQSGTNNFAEAVSQLEQAKGLYDAILVPEGGQRLVAFIDELRRQGLLTRADGKQVQLLGSGLWDDGNLTNQQNLMGGWYAAPDPTARLGFMTRYSRAFEAEPIRIASLAYDATALAAVLAANGWPYTPQTLTQPQGFDGVDGVFRIQNNGLVQRGLSVLQFAPSGLQIIDPAPKRF